MPGEYLLGMAVALGLVAVELFLVSLVGGEAPDMAVPIFLVVAIYGSLAMVVVGIPVVLVTHLMLRRVRSQTAHVAAFAVAGLLTALLPGLMLGAGRAGLSIYVAAALAGGASRAVLIPVLRARAARAAALPTLVM